MRIAHPTATACTMALALATVATAQVPDHLACFKIRDPQAKAMYTADLAGLVSYSGCLVRVPAVMACVPSTQTNVQPPPTGMGGTGTPNAFGCYKVKCPKTVLPTIQLDDQFGSRVVTPKTAKLVCAPTTPPTTTTVSTTTTTSVTSTTLSGQLCDLPGSLRFEVGGTVTVPGGGPEATALAFLHLPTGFCAHYYGTVPNARQMRVAPGGELFVASPTTPSTEGGQLGVASLVALPDDDQDGRADSTLTFQSGLPSTQGFVFANGHLYYQDGIDVRRFPYVSGDRTPSGPSEQVATIDGYVSGLNWQKPLEAADDGTIYVGNGGDNGEACDPMRPFHGGILSLDSLHGTAIAKGMFAPRGIRCAHGTGQCFALDMALPFTAEGRDKLVRIQPGTDFGHPCCATTGVPYSSVSPTPDCSAITSETVALGVDERPFGLDFSPATWPGTFANATLASIHGVTGSGVGARIILLRPDGMTGLPSAPLVDFATGWDNGTLSHGQPSDVTFGPDGRLWVANDQNGTIFWIAPIQ